MEVSINKASGTYSIRVGTEPGPPNGKLHHSTCIPNRGCTESDTPVSAGGCFPGEIDGPLSSVKNLACLYSGNGLWAAFLEECANCAYQ